MFIMLSYLDLIQRTGVGNGNPLQSSCMENARTEEPGALQSMGSHRVEHNRVTENKIQKTTRNHPRLLHKRIRWQQGKEGMVWRHVCIEEIQWVKVQLHRDR